MKLFLDIGNQYMKWLTSPQLEMLSSGDLVTVLADQAVPSDAGNVSDCLRGLFDDQSEISSVVVSSVASSQVNQALSNWCRKFSAIDPYFLIASEKACAVDNLYAESKMLGIDRWCAVVAAAQQVGEAQAVLVIDAGTAITIDFLNSNHQFTGGIIFPGIATMFQSLNRSTGQIFAELAAESPLKINLINDNTDRAVMNGVVHSVISAVDQAISYHCDVDNENFQTIITGGDAMRIKNKSRFQMQYIPELVLAGVCALAQEQNL